MDSLSKKVLITGINGFTGKYLSDYYTERNFSVYGITNNAPPNQPHIFSCDLLEKERLIELIDQIQPEIVVHLAAISFVGHEDLTEMYQVNVLGTQNLLEAIRLKGKQKVEKILLASSATVYGNQLETELSEQMCPNPVNHYGISKLAMEQVAKMYFDDLPILITRPFNYTAPEQSTNFVIPKIASAFKNKQQTLELGNIEVFREYNSIHFICECYYLLSISDYQSTVVNLCSGITYSLKEVIDYCSELSNHTLEVKINERFVRSNEIIRLSGSPKKLNEMIQLSQNYFLKETLALFFRE